MPTLRPIEILLIILVVLLLFGAKRLPELARSVGKSLKILKTEVKELGDDTPANATVPTVLPVTDVPIGTPAAAHYLPTVPAAPANPAYREQQ